MTSVRQLLLTSLLFVVGCVPLTEVELALNEDTSSLTGWLSARGEWTLFHTAGLDQGYYPYTDQEHEKCISLVNATGSPRSEYSRRHGELVIVFGEPIAYDDLEIGNSAADRLLSKRYYEDEVVENFCLRDLVFVVSDMYLFVD